jgi:hypothetical protein
LGYDDGLSPVLDILQRHSRCHSLNSLLHWET